MAIISITTGNNKKTCACNTWQHILYSLPVSLYSSTGRWVYHPGMSPPCSQWTWTISQHQLSKRRGYRTIMSDDRLVMLLHTNGVTDQYLDSAKYSSYKQVRFLVDVQDSEGRGRVGAGCGRHHACHRALQRIYWYGTIQPITAERKEKRGTLMFWFNVLKAGEGGFYELSLLKMSYRNTSQNSFVAVESLSCTMRSIFRLGCCFQSRNSLSALCRATFLRLIVCVMPLVNTTGKSLRWKCMVQVGRLLGLADGLYKAPLQHSQRKTGFARLHCIYVMMCQRLTRLQTLDFPSDTTGFLSQNEWNDVLLYFCFYNSPLKGWRQIRVCFYKWLKEA